MRPLHVSLQHFGESETRSRSSFTRAADTVLPGTSYSLRSAAGSQGLAPGQDTGGFAPDKSHLSPCNLGTKHGRATVNPEFTPAGAEEHRPHMGPRMVPPALWLVFHFALCVWSGLIGAPWTSYSVHLLCAAHSMEEEEVPHSHL